MPYYVGDGVLVVVMMVEMELVVVMGEGVSLI
jgi:hypothetical protein